MNYIVFFIYVFSMIPVILYSQTDYPILELEENLNHQDLNSETNYNTSILEQITISGNVFSDDNFNGVRDATESGIANANVTIRGPEGFLVNTTTNSNGIFTVSGPEGFYDEIGVGPTDCQSYCRQGFGNYIGLGYTFEVVDDVTLLFAFEPGEDYNNDQICDRKDYLLSHSHQNEAHSFFSQPRLIQRQEAFFEDTTFFSVCADGTDVSIIELKNLQDCEYDYFYLSAKIVEDEFSNDPDTYGSIEIIKQEAEFFEFKYQHPDHLPLETAKNVEYTIQLDYNDGMKMETLGYIKIKVWYPPVVMVHGLWSEPSAFEAMRNELLNSGHYDPAQLFRADYENTHDLSFSQNAWVVPVSIHQVVKKMLNVDIAAGAVDVVCHSMGGILTRLYLQEGYTYPYANDIHKLITCNTPHAGAQSANFLLDQPNEIADALMCGFVVKHTLGECNNGAVENLQVYSDAIKSLNAPGRSEVSVPSHVIITHSNVSELINIPEETVEILNDVGQILEVIPVVSQHPATKLFTGLITPLSDANTFTNALFNNENHDIVVADPSQRAGLALSYTSLYPDQWHIGSVANQEVMDRVEELLMAHPKQGQFALEGFSPTRLDYNNPFGLKSASSSTLSINVLSPIKGDTISVGDTLIIEANGSPSVTDIVCLVELTLDTIYRAEVDSSYAKFAFIVDSTLIGRRNFLVSGFNEQTREILIDTSYFFIQPWTTLDSISVSPSTIEVETGSSKELEILGYYGDSNDPVDIGSLPDLQFSFQEEKASKLGSRLVQGDSIGIDTLYISYDSISSVAIPVKVKYSSILEDFLEQVSFTFDGVDDLIVGPSHPSLELDDGTIELWIKPQQKATSQTFLCYRDDTGFQTRYLWNFLGNLSGLGFWNGISYTVLNHQFTPNVWIHLAFVDDGTETKVYLDGNLIGAFPTQFGIANGDDLSLVFGNDIPGAEFFVGEMDEIRIWSYPKNQEQIEVQRLCKLSGVDSCLVAYYNFQTGLVFSREPDTYILSDLSGNGLDCIFQKVSLDENVQSWIETSIPSPESCLTGYSNFCDTDSIVFCADSLFIDDTPILSNTFKAGSYLSSLGEIESGDSVHFRAGVSIKLLSGFEAMAGSYFSASIENCSSTITTPTDNISVEERSVDFNFELPVRESRKNQDEQGYTLTISPNPVKNIATIRSKYAYNEYVLQDATGRIIFQVNSNDYITDIDVSKLQGGIYFLSAKAKEYILTKKIIVE